MNIDILFVISPPLWQILPHAGIAYLAGYLKKNNIICYAYDLNIEFYNNLQKDIKKNWTTSSYYISNDFSLFLINNFFSIIDNFLNFVNENEIKYIAFTCYKSNMNFILNILKIIEKRHPDIDIILGGPEIFSLYTKNELSSLDKYILIIGEGESHLDYIIKNNIKKGIFLRNQLKEINHSPDYSIFELKKYKKNTLPLVFSRGCINRCRFCSERLLFEKYRTVDVNEFVDQIIYFLQRYNINNFIFYDSIFNGDLNKMYSLLELIINKNINIKWEAQIAIRKDMDIALMKLMKRSGCINLFIGIESGCNNTLKRMNKSFDTEIAIEFLNNLYNSNLQYEISLIAGFPLETEEEFTETLNFLENNRKIIKKIAQISRFRLYPGIEKNYNKEEIEGIKDEISSLRIKKLLQKIEELKIPYTKSYIDNLI